MIHVDLAPAPDDFDQRVNQPGLDAIRELVGEAPLNKRRGKKIQQVADKRENIPAEKFPPYWQKVIPDLLDKYKRICAYSALYIHPGTGTPSVDHLVAKDQAWDQVYEWSNYRLACLNVNAKKGIKTVLDPFEIDNGLFALEFVAFQVMPGPLAITGLRDQVIHTIESLQLNSSEFCKARCEYVEAYKGGGEYGKIDFDYLKRHAPFIAMEMTRQGLLE